MPDRSRAGLWRRRWQAIRARLSGTARSEPGSEPGSGPCAAEQTREGATASDSTVERWVVLDCETTGLSPDRDELLSIGAVAMVGGAIRLADRFERRLQPRQRASVENILLHGIGLQAQQEADETGQVLRDWQAWVADAPCVAFHAAFDRGFLERAMARHLAAIPRYRWLDLAELGPALDPASRARALDDWLTRYEIQVNPRHHASADALASALLLQRWLARLPEAQRRFSVLSHLARNRRFLGG
jgi:DNA polymerase-3 subunit epsilon